MQTLQYFRVPQDLQPFLGMVYSGVAEPGPTPLPSMMAQLWVCTFPVYWSAPGTIEPQRLSPVTLMGPVMGANTVHVQERGLIMGLGLWPQGWAELVRISAIELTDTAIDGTLIWPARCVRLLDDLQGLRHWSLQAAKLIEFVRSLLPSATQTAADAAFIPTIDRWLRDRQPVEALASQLGYSYRQVERITARTHGGPPRLLATRQRALRAASVLANDRVEKELLWSEYADQSHFIREFRRFVGGTPKGFGSESRIGHSMFSKSWKSDDKHPLAYGA